MLKILKNKKGITLVELVVGIVVLAIILATVSAILFPMMTFQSRANELAEQNALLDDLANQIIYDLSMATREIEPIVLEPGSNQLIIRIHPGAGGEVRYRITPEPPTGTTEPPRGVILRQQGIRLVGTPPTPTPYINPLLPEEFHMRMNRTGLRVTRIELSVDTTDGRVYTLELTLSNETPTQPETLRFQREYAVRPLALNQNN